MCRHRPGGRCKSGPRGYRELSPRAAGRAPIGAPDYLVAHHERREQAVHLVDDGLASTVRHIGDRDSDDAPMTAVSPHVDLAVDSLFLERGQNPGKDALGGVPAESWFEDLSHAGERHRINLDDLDGGGRAFGGALANPGFEFTGGTRPAGL